MSKPPRHAVLSSKQVSKLVALPWRLVDWLSRKQHLISPPRKKLWLPAVTFSRKPQVFWKVRSDEYAKTFPVFIQLNPSKANLSHSQSEAFTSRMPVSFPLPIPAPKRPQPLPWGWSRTFFISSHIISPVLYPTLFPLAAPHLQSATPSPPTSGPPVPSQNLKTRLRLNPLTQPASSLSTRKAAYNSASSTVSSFSTRTSNYSCRNEASGWSICDTRWGI